MDRIRFQSKQRDVAVFIVVGVTPEPPPSILAREIATRVQERAQGGFALEKMHLVEGRWM